MNTVVLLDTDFGNGPIPRPEESYYVWSVWVRSRNLNNKAALHRAGLLRRRKKKSLPACKISSNITVEASILVEKAALKLVWMRMKMEYAVMLKLNLLEKFDIIWTVHRDKFA